MDPDRIEIKPFAAAALAMVVMEAGCRTWLASFFRAYPLEGLMGLRLLEILALTGIAIFLGRGLKTVGLAPDLCYAGFVRGLRWSLIFAVAAGLSAGILVLLNLNPVKLVRSTLPGPPDQLVLFFAAGVFIGPLAEEIFFRGFLYGFLRRRGMVPALVLSNLLFVGLHFPAPSIPLPQIVGGIVFTLAYEQKGELTAPLTIHALGNLALFLLSLFWGGK